MLAVTNLFVLLKVSKFYSLKSTLSGVRYGAKIMSLCYRRTKWEGRCRGGKKPLSRPEPLLVQSLPLPGFMGAPQARNEASGALSH